MNPPNIEPRQETLRLRNPNGQTHQVVVLFHSTESQAILGAYYDEGSAAAVQGTQIVNWCASYLPPNRFDPGVAHLGNGRIDLDIPSLRGMGLGSLLMRPLVSWLRSHALDVPVATINLSAEDAKAQADGRIRNQFYKKLGFNFKFEDTEQTWGESLPLHCSALLIPKFCLSRGWEVESIAGTGAVFWLESASG